ncbi:hypothetical protein, partial [Methylomonas koyamae]|uniref:hypothetical protein n=1 Tax=Methylomonas koyamae TaxID=702114 RepID=UPI001E6503C8
EGMLVSFNFVILSVRLWCQTPLWLRLGKFQGRPITTFLLLDCWNRYHLDAHMLSVGPTAGVALP